MIDIDLKAQRRREIIDAGFQVFTKSGFSGATMGEIAVAAGLGKGTIYEYFPSKADLFVAIVGDTLVRYHHVIEREFSATGSFENKLRRSAIESISLLGSSFFSLSNCLQSPQINEGVHRKMLEFKASTQELFLGAIEQAQRAGELKASLSADTILNCLNGVMMIAAFLVLSGHSADDCAAQITHVIDAFLYGISA